MSPTQSWKQCRCCGETKASTAFPVDRKYKGGRSSRCKQCLAEYASNRYQRLRREQGKGYRRMLRMEEWNAIIDQGVMTCRTCHVIKPLSEFRPSNRPPFRRRQCRACFRQRCAQLRIEKRAERDRYNKAYRCQKYGITPAHYDRLLDAQDGACAVCRRPLDRLHQTIDHDHRTGKVRGIVHRNCNLVLGNARENIGVLLGAVAYLRKHKYGKQSVFESTEYDTNYALN